MARGKITLTNYSGNLLFIEVQRHNIRKLLPAKCIIEEEKFSHMFRGLMLKLEREALMW